MAKLSFHPPTITVKRDSFDLPERNFSLIQDLALVIKKMYIDIAKAINELYVSKWDDLRFPAANLKNGASGVPTWDNTNGLQEFSVGDYVFFQAQMPHAWAVGTEIRPHIHWQKISSAAGNVHWQIDYRICRIGEVWDASASLSDETPDVSDGDTARQHALTALGAIDMSGEDISDMIVGKISRVAAAGSEYGTRAALLEFDIHYQLDSKGSTEEYIK